VVLLHARKYISTRRKSQLMHTRRHSQYLIARLEVFLKNSRAHSPAFQATSIGAGLGYFVKKESNILRYYSYHTCHSMCSILLVISELW
jgi:hypothetical protein